MIDGAVQVAVVVQELPSDEIADWMFRASSMLTALVVRRSRLRSGRGRRRRRRRRAPQAAIPAELALDRTLPIDPAVRTGQAAQRTAVISSASNGRPGQSRLDASGRERRRRFRKKPISAGSRTSSSTWRSTAREHFKPGELVDVPRIDRRALRPARERLDVVRRDDLHARRARPIAPATSTRADGAAATSPAACRCCRRKSTRSAASCSRNGAAGSAPARACTDKQLPVLLPGLALRRAAADWHARRS